MLVVRVLLLMGASYVLWSVLAAGAACVNDSACVGRGVRRWRAWYTGQPDLTARQFNALNRGTSRCRSARPRRCRYSVHVMY